MGGVTALLLNGPLGAFAAIAGALLATYPIAKSMRGDR